MVLLAQARNPKTPSSWPTPYLHISVLRASACVLPTSSCPAKDQTLSWGRVSKETPSHTGQAQRQAAGPPRGRPEMAHAQEAIQAWSVWGDGQVLLILAKKKVCVGGMKASRDGKMQASLARGAKKFKEQTCHPSQRNFHLMRNSFQRENSRQRANLSRPHHSATLKLCSKMTYSNVFNVWV